MTFLHIGIIYLCVFIAGMMGAKWAASFEQKQTHGVQMVSDKPLGLIVMLTLFVSAGLFLWGQDFQIIFAGTALVSMAGVAMLLVRADLTDMKAISFLSVIGLAASYCLPDSFFSENALHGMLVHIGAAFVWAFLTWIFMQINRVPFLSMSLSMGWFLAYLIVALRLNLMPSAFGYLAISLLVIQIGINTVLKKGWWPVLTPSACVFIGFLWAGLAVYMMLAGYPLYAAMLYAYPVFEVLLSMIVSVFLYRTFIPVCPFLIEKALGQNVFPEKALRYVMLLGIGFSGLAVSVVLPTENVVKNWWLIATVVLLLHAYIRLNTWKEGKPKLRDLFHDAKMGVQVLKQEFKNMPFKKMKNPQGSEETVQMGKATVAPKKSHRKQVVKNIKKDGSKRTCSTQKTPRQTTKRRK